MDHALALFRERYKGTPIIVQAPGRINLIGEHVDYNLGFVMPGAIDKHFVFVAADNGTDRCRLYSSDFNSESTFGIDELAAGPHWFNYFMGVLDGFRRRGKNIGGVDCVFGGTIPSGGGLSSSAALCCGFGFALNEIFGCGLEKLELALIAQHAEHQFAGVKCGLMDQYASLFGQRDSLLLLDCRSNTHERVPFPSDQCVIVLADTRVKHSLASSAYNDRRAACEEGVSKLQSLYPDVKSLRDVSTAQLEAGRSRLQPEVYRRCHYVVTEMERTRLDNLMSLNQAGFLEGMTFDSFITEMGSLTANEKISLQIAKREAMAFAESPAGWLLLRGGYGCGKTHLAAAIANYRLQRGQLVLFLTTPDLLDHLRGAFGPDSTVSYDERFEQVRNTPLLILDDFGTQSNTAWAEEKLYQIINHRYALRLPTVITTNLDED